MVVKPESAGEMADGGDFKGGHRRLSLSYGGGEAGEKEGREGACVKVGWFADEQGAFHCVCACGVCVHEEFCAPHRSGLKAECEDSSASL